MIIHMDFRYGCLAPRYLGTDGASHPLKLRLRDLAHLEQFLMDRLKPLPGVVRTHTLIVLSTTKETHLVPAPLPGPA